MSRTIDAELAARYRAMTNEDLAEAREDLLARMEDDDVDQGVVDEADACSAEHEARQRVAQRRARLAQGLRDQGGGREGRGQRRLGDTEGARTPDVGAELTASAGWRAFAANGYAGRTQIDIADARALISTSTPAGLTGVQRLPEVMGGPTTFPGMIDIVPVVPTTLGKVEWVAETQASQAAPAAGAVEVAEGSPKPEASLAFEVDSVDVQVIATWVQISRQLVDDAGGVESYLQARLTTAVRARLASQIINGTGVAPLLRGLLATAGVQSKATVAGDDASIAARKCMTLVQNAGHTPTHYIVSPTDAEKADLAVDTQTRLQDRSPLALPTRIVDKAMPVGTMVVGGFTGDAIALRLRQQATLLISDSHSTNFTANILILLAEMRAALAVYAPSAFVKTTLT